MAYGYSWFMIYLKIMSSSRIWLQQTLNKNLANTSCLFNIHQSHILEVDIILCNSFRYLYTDSFVLKKKHLHLLKSSEYDWSSHIHTNFDRKQDSLEIPQYQGLSEQRSRLHCYVHLICNKKYVHLICNKKLLAMQCVKIL